MPDNLTTKFQSSSEIPLNNARILVVIPAYNGARTISRLLKNLSRQNINQVFVVNDGSADETSRILLEHSVQHVTHEYNLGKGTAIKTAAKWAVKRGYDWILTMDADLQHPPASVVDFIQNRDLNTIVIGDRRDLSPMPLMRRFSNRLTSLLLSIRANRLLRDSQCGFRLLPVQIFQECSFSYSGFQFESEVLIKAIGAGYKIEHIDIPTVYGDEESAMRNFKDTVKFAAMYFHSFIW